MTAKPFKTLKKGDPLAIIGYKGDGIIRDVLVDTVHDNRIVVWDRNRKVFRAYIYKDINRIGKVKV